MTQIRTSVVAQLALKRKLKRMIPLTDDEHRDLSVMPIRQRQGWAKARNERKRARQGRP